MEFKKYNSIENTYQEKFLEKCFYTLEGYNDFIVQEKIHGANFAFYVNSGKITCAKRTSFLNPDDNFFDFQNVLKKYEKVLIRLQKEIGKNIVVLGELFGGGVQKGVFYSSYKDFYAFDIKVDGEYISTDEANKYFEDYGFIYAKTLFRGSLEDCLSYEVEGVNVKTLLEPYEGDNIWEGIVIRPNKTFFLGNPDDSSRVIFKKKASAFSEKKAPSKIHFDTSSFEDYEIYITENRLDGIMGKYGPIQNKSQLQEYTGYFVKDIVEDIEKEGKNISKNGKQYIFKKSIKFILGKAL